jgi:hypothetical protein
MLSFFELYIFIEPIHSPGLSKLTLMSNSGGRSQLSSPPQQQHSQQSNNKEEVHKLQLKDLTPSEQMEIMERLDHNGDWVEGAGWGQFLDPIVKKRKEKEQAEQRTIIENNST